MTETAIEFDSVELVPVTEKTVYFATPEKALARAKEREVQHGEC